MARKSPPLQLSPPRDFIPPAIWDTGWLFGFEKQVVVKGPVASAGLLEFWATSGHADWMFWLAVQLDILTIREQRGLVSRCVKAANGVCTSSDMQLRTPTSLALFNHGLQEINRAARDSPRDMQRISTLTAASGAYYKIKYAVETGARIGQLDAYEASVVAHRMKHADWLREVVSAERLKTAIDRLNKSNKKGFVRGA